MILVKILIKILFYENIIHVSTKVVRVTVSQWRVTSCTVKGPVGSKYPSTAIYWTFGTPLRNYASRNPEKGTEGDAFIQLLRSSFCNLWRDVASCNVKLLFLF